MAYSASVRAEARRLYVEREKTPDDIAQIMGGKPSRSTIAGWATAMDADGKTWDDYRRAEADALFEDSSPRAMALKIIRRINELLNKPDFDEKTADALSKLQKNLASVADRAYQIPAMYDVLTDLLLFMREHHPELVTPALLGVVRRFKNQLIERLEA